MLVPEVKEVLKNLDEISYILILTLNKSDTQKATVYTSDEQIEKHFCVHRIGPLHHPVCPLCLNDHLPVRAGEKKGNLPVADCDNIQL